MGIGGYSRSRYPSRSRVSGANYEQKTPVSEGNPDPGNFKILKSQEIGEFLLLLIHYPNCNNYEGNKILVFRGVTPLDLLNQKLIDPHFDDNESYKSPIARFVPTDQGWELAVQFATHMDFQNPKFSLDTLK